MYDISPACTYSIVQGSVAYNKKDILEIIFNIVINMLHFVLMLMIMLGVSFNHYPPPITRFCKGTTNRDILITIFIVFNLLPLKKERQLIIIILYNAVTIYIHSLCSALWCRYHIKCFNYQS